MSFGWPSLRFLVPFTETSHFTVSRKPVDRFHYYMMSWDHLDKFCTMKTKMKSNIVADQNKSLLTFPTYCGSEPMYSSRTKNWFHTHPLLMRWALNLPCLQSLVLLCSNDATSPTDDLTLSLKVFPLAEVTASWVLLWSWSSRGIWKLHSNSKQEPSRNRVTYSLVIIRESWCSKNKKRRETFTKLASPRLGIHPKQSLCKFKSEQVPKLQCGQWWWQNDLLTYWPHWMTGFSKEHYFKCLFRTKKTCCFVFSRKTWGELKYSLVS